MTKKKKKKNKNKMKKSMSDIGGDKKNYNREREEH